MSTESLVCDIEKGGVIVVRESRPADGRWKCLSICSFLLLVGATAVFALLHFRNGGPLISQDPKEPRSSGHTQLTDPMTMKLQAQSLKKPAAHVVASSDSKELIWTDKVAHTMMQNGMALVNNKLVVPSDGLYFIYSQVVFKGDKCPEESIPLRHTILRYSVEYPENVPLLMAIKSFCEGSKAAKNEEGVWFESIYQGAVFQLMKGDEISSEIDSAQYLDLDSNGQVYFGVIALELGAPQ
ncbi:tumor necrosis factor-like [Terrapene carolina triunguis]|uniref:tumor necrosis factor n=1 Tax=Terrapene triunguis TaxID=2587831 RepID=UPI001156848F|nr:tumor necrosis factor [Terrapene carolina triunguis]XP_029770242.1 tumor necrosis factor-like [Terrapene carolina triunguis]